MKLLWRLKWCVMILVAALVPVLILLPHLAAVLISAGVAASLFVLLVYDRRMLYRPLLRIRKGLEEERVEEVLQEIRLE